MFPALLEYVKGLPVSVIENFSVDAVWVMSEKVAVMRCIMDNVSDAGRYFGK